MYEIISLVLLVQINYPIENIECNEYNGEDDPGDGVYPTDTVHTVPPPALHLHVPVLGAAFDAVVELGAAVLLHFGVVHVAAVLHGQMGVAVHSIM